MIIRSQYRRDSALEIWLARMRAKPAPPPQPAVKPAEQLVLPVALPTGTRQGRLARLREQFLANHEVVAR
jgi:hypothetical protein